MDRKGLIASALEFRFRELCRLEPTRLEKIRPASPVLIDKLISRFGAAEPTAFQGTPFRGFSAASDGCSASGDFFSIMSDVAEGRPIDVHTSEPSSVNMSGFAKQKLEDRFRSLTGVGSPFVFLVTPGEPFREEILRQVMVHFRHRLDLGEFEAISADFILCALNLICLYSLVHDALRFLDAVNYWWERIPATWTPQGQYPILWAYLVGIYGRALVANVGRYRC